MKGGYLGEIDEIEADWLHEIQIALGSAERVEPIRRPLPTGGTPPWYWKLHALRIAAEQQAEAAAFPAALRHAGNGATIE